MTETNKLMNKRHTSLAIGLTAMATVSGASVVSAAGSSDPSDQRSKHDAAHMQHTAMRAPMPTQRDHGRMPREMTKAHRHSMGIDRASGMSMMQMR